MTPSKGVVPDSITFHDAGDVLAASCSEMDSTVRQKGAKENLRPSNIELSRPAASATAKPSNRVYVSYALLKAGR